MLESRVEGETMAIITISRQIGSLGDEIADAVADKLGYEQINKSQIGEILSRHGFTESEVDEYDEKKPSIWHTLTTKKNIFAYLIEAAVYELAARDNVLIVGRGAQIILKDIPGTLHVRIIAPYADRVRRVMEQLGCEEKNARRMIHRNDRDSSGYISTYFDADLDDTYLYDLVINTRKITMTSTIELIRQAVGADGFKKSLLVREKLNDLALTRKGLAALLEVRDMETANLSVEKGTASLSGMARSIAAREACEQALLNIEGITTVENHLGLFDTFHAD